MHKLLLVNTHSQAGVHKCSAHKQIPAARTAGTCRVLASTLFNVRHASHWGKHKLREELLGQICIQIATWFPRHREAFYVKTMKATVNIPGQRGVVHNNNGFTNVYPMDQDAMTWIATNSTGDDTIESMLQAIVDKFLTAFPSVTVHQGFVALSDVLPPKSFAKWYKMQQDMDNGVNIMMNDVYDWVPATGDNDADNAAALAYLKKGREQNALFASSQDSGSQNGSQG